MSRPISKYSWPANRSQGWVLIFFLPSFRNNKPFRVYITIPLFAAFEGIPGDKKAGSNIHAILRWTRASIFKGPSSLMSRLRMVVPRVEDYVSVSSLRTYDRWPDGQYVSAALATIPINGTLTLGKLQRCPDWLAKQGKRTIVQAPVHAFLFARELSACPHTCAH